MKKFICGIIVAMSIAVPAHAHGPYGGLSGTQGLLLGGAIGWVVGRSAPPQQIIIQPNDYNIVRIPLEPQLTAPRVYSLPNAPYPGAAPVYEERWQYEPSCQCQVKIFNQIGWR